MKSKASSTINKKVSVPAVSLAAPRLIKAVINAGVGKLRKDKPKLEAVAKDLAIITGQKPAFTRARQSVSGFAVRQGEVVGYKVTLRRGRLKSFVERLVKLALPRTRDFRGLPAKGFDGRGNFTLGIKDHTVFPEIRPDEVIGPFGFEVTLVTSARDDEGAQGLLKALGFPLAKD